MASSVIDQHSYDAQRRALTIRFASGRRYVYHEVPPEIAAALAGALSQGRFFNAAIRDAFPAREIDPPRRPRPD